MDELSNPTYFFHDGLRRVDRSMDALFKSTYFEFDARGGRVKRISAAAEAGTTYMSYDAAARLESQWFASAGTPDKPIYFAYDQVSNLTSADDSLAGIGITTNEFDKLDRLTKKHNLGGAVYYQYDASSKRIELKNPDLVKTNYVIDEAGRTWQVSMSGPEGVTRSYYEYDDADVQTRKVLPSNAVISYYHHDDAGRLQTLKNLDSSLAVINYFHYDRNENGAIERIQHEGGKWTYYAFDALDRLTDERQHTNPQVYRKTYVYDAASNRTTKAETIAPSSEVFTFYDYNAANLLEEERIGSTSANYFAYDDSQRMNAQWTSGSEATYFDHNQRDQIGGLRFVGTGDTDHSWDYTGTGERALMIGGQGGTTPTYLAYDGNQLLTERDKNDFVYGSYRHSRLRDPYGDLIGGDDQEAGSLVYPTFDQRGSVQTLEGVSGSAEFDLHGVTISNDLASTLRVGFAVPRFIGLNTTQSAYLASNGLLLPATACLTGALFCPAVLVGGRLRRGPLLAPGQARRRFDFGEFVYEQIFGSEDAPMQPGPMGPARPADLGSPEPFGSVPPSSECVPRYIVMYGGKGMGATNLKNPSKHPWGKLRTDLGPHRLNFRLQDKSPGDLSYRHQRLGGGVKGGEVVSLVYSWQLEVKFKGNPKNCKVWVHARNQSKIGKIQASPWSVDSRSSPKKPWSSDSPSDRRAFVGDTFYAFDAPGFHAAVRSPTQRMSQVSEEQRLAWFRHQFQVVVQGSWSHQRCESDIFTVGSWQSVKTGEYPGGPFGGRTSESSDVGFWACKNGRRISKDKRNTGHPWPNWPHFK